MTPTKPTTRLSTADSQAVLNRVRVASPCAESWEAMPGGERIRSCDRCQHKVYNLSEMTADEAARLVQEAEGRLCVRFYRRVDGTMLTRDCPVGLRAVRMRAARALSAAFASVMLLFGISLAGKSRSEQPTFVRWVLNKVDPEPVRPLMGAIPLQMAPPSTPEPPAIMGDIAIEPPRATMGELVERPEMGKVSVSDGPTMGAIASPGH
jgi:hypothetical protein